MENGYYELKDVRKACREAGFTLTQQEGSINIKHDGITSQYDTDLYGTTDAYNDVISRYGDRPEALYQPQESTQADEQTSNGAAQWTQLYVKAPEGNQYTSPQTMKRIDDHIGGLLAALKCPPPSGLPVQEPDGTWEVRVYQTALLPMVKSVLTGHYGLDIVREVPHD